MGESELSGICFRFPNDLTLVAHEKKAMSLAEYIHLCSTVHGVANFEIANHTLLQKQYEPALWCSSSSYTCSLAHLMLFSLDSAFYVMALR